MRLLFSIKKPIEIPSTSRFVTNFPELSGLPTFARESETKAAWPVRIQINSSQRVSHQREMGLYSIHKN